MTKARAKSMPSLGSRRPLEFNGFTPAGAAGFKPAELLHTIDTRAPERQEKFHSFHCRRKPTKLQTKRFSLELTYVAGIVGKYC